MVMKLCFFCQLQSPNHGTVKVLGFVVVWAIFTFDFFKIETYLLDNFFNDMVFLGGRGLAFTRKSERDMELVAAADGKRKEPKVACLACLTLVKKSGRGKKGSTRLLHFLSKNAF